MIEALLGLGVGAVGGYVVRGQMAPTTPDNTQEQQELYNENEKLARRNKEQERRIEDLMAEVAKLQRKAKSSSNASDDMQDSLDDAKAETAKLRRMCDKLTASLEEYKRACAAQEAEIKALKEKR